MRSANQNQEEINRTCPGAIIGSPITQCRYLINMKNRGALPSTASTDCNPRIDNANCARHSLYIDKI
jgi:hypothetical protein